MRACTILVVSLLFFPLFMMGADDTLPVPSLTDGKLIVYRDHAFAGNHFPVKLKISGEGDETLVLPLQEQNTTEVYSGRSCIACEVRVQNDSWGGWLFTQGYHTANAVPEPNYGQYPGCGFNLTGADRLTFMAKGDTGAEWVEFFVGGLGWNPDSGKPNQPYPDSTPKISLGVIQLGTDYAEYTISLAGADVSYLCCGFGFVVSGTYNNEDVRFYLDDIVIHFEKAPAGAVPVSSAQAGSSSAASPGTAPAPQSPAPAAASPDAAPVPAQSPDIPVALITALGGIVGALIGAFALIYNKTRRPPNPPAEESPKNGGKTE